MRGRHDPAAQSILAQRRRDRAHPSVDPYLGSARREFVTLGRQMACSRSDCVLSHYGNSVDYPLETIDPMDAGGCN